MDSTAAPTLTKSRLLAAGRAWRALEDAIGPLNARHTARNADRMTSLIDAMLEVAPAGGGPRGNAALLTFLMDWLTEYEAATLPPPPQLSPVALLNHLKEANGLRQEDLAPLLGGQSTVSLILRGKRRINLRQAQALALRFGVSPAAFIEVDTADPAAPQVQATSGSAPSVQREQPTASQRPGPSALLSGLLDQQLLSASAPAIVQFDCPTHAY